MGGERERSWIIMGMAMRCGSLVEMPGLKVFLGTKIGLRRVITCGTPWELLDMEVVSNINIGLSRGIAFMILGLYVLSDAESIQGVVFDTKSG